MVEALTLHKMSNRKWHIQGACATYGEGIYEALEQLSSMVKDFKRNQRFWIDKYCDTIKTVAFRRMSLDEGERERERAKIHWPIFMSNFIYAYQIMSNTLHV